MFFFKVFSVGLDDIIQSGFRLRNCFYIVFCLRDWFKPNLHAELIQFDAPKAE